MTEAEKKVAEAKANAATAQSTSTQSKTKDKLGAPEMEAALTKVSDTQYQRGLDFTKAIAEHSFMQGVEDQISVYLEAPEISQETIGAVTRRFQSVAAKRLKPATATIDLPDFWALGEGNG